MHFSCPSPQPPNSLAPCICLGLLAGRKVKDVETQANLLFDRLKPLKRLEENLSRNLSEIKLLISQARKQAASVSAGPLLSGASGEPRVPQNPCGGGFLSPGSPRMSTDQLSVIPYSSPPCLTYIYLSIFNYSRFL